jgi:hypothetical protein
MTEGNFFEIGDKVVCVENNLGKPEYIGKIGTIINIQGVFFPYKLKFNDGSRIWCEVRKPLEIELLLDGL